MTDMLTTIIPKSDQLNSDDLIGRSITIKVTKVSLMPGEQPIAINYEGDGGKPYKPGKSMRRVMVSVWGGDGNSYVGKSMTLYRDEKVMFGGLAVGGIRISHMSHIENSITLALTASKANRKPFTVKPLVAIAGLSDNEIELLKAAGIDEAKKGSGALKSWWSELGGTKHKQLGTAYLDMIKSMAAQADKIIVDSEQETVPLLDRVNTACAEISMDREYIATNDFKSLRREVMQSENQELINKLNEAMQEAK